MIGADQVDPQLAVEHGLPYHALAWVVAVVPEVDRLSRFRLQDDGDPLTDTSAADQTLDSCCMRQPVPLPRDTLTFFSIRSTFFDKPANRYPSISVKGI